MKVSIKWMLWKYHQRADNTYTICFRVTIDRKSKYYMLPYSIRKAGWDTKNNRVKSAETDSYHLNLFLDKEQIRVKEIAYAMQLEGHVSINEFDNRYKSRIDKKIFSEFIDEFYKIDPTRFKAETLRSHKTILGRIDKYKKNLLISDINQDFIIGFKNYMLSEMNLNQTTVDKTFKTMQARLNDAIELGIIKTNPFDKVKYKGVHERREYLTSSEVRTLEELYAKNILLPGQQKTLLHFLFMCYTSLAYGEIRKLRKQDIQIELIDGKKTEFIRLIRGKTEKPISVPLLDKAKEIARTGNLSGKLFNVQINKTMNEHLKIIMAAANIDKNISTHCARNTFGTLGLEHGMNFDVLSNILGHSDLKTTHIYASFTDRLKVQELRKMND